MEPEELCSDIENDLDVNSENCGVSPDNEANVSALRDSIKKKGSNSYYYAHGAKIDGPVWDGREEPRLLYKSPSLDGNANQGAASKVYFH